MLPWQLDLISQKEIRTEGLFAALNDCLYRSMYRFQYAAMVDFDEVIVPKLRPNATVLVSFHAVVNAADVAVYMRYSRSPSRTESVVIRVRFFAPIHFK